MGQTESLLPLYQCSVRYERWCLRYLLAIYSFKRASLLLICNTKYWRNEVCRAVGQREGVCGIIQPTCSEQRSVTLYTCIDQNYSLRLLAWYLGTACLCRKILDIACRAVLGRRTHTHTCRLHILNPLIVSQWREVHRLIHQANNPDTIAGGRLRQTLWDCCGIVSSSSIRDLS